jgi:predicted P-loop ATPase
VSLIDQLQALPDGWGLVAVDGSKRPYQPDWQHNALTKQQIAAEITAGRARAIGVIAGPTSGGLLFVDHDGLSATGKLEELGLPLRDLPKSLAMTSGRDGRFQIIYGVPPDYWPHMKGRRVFRTGATDDTGKAEQLELRWHGHQSVVIGAHPQTSGYRWLSGRGPGEQALADAPLALIELLLNDPEPPPTPPAPLLDLLPSVDAVPFLDFISRDSRQLIESGGTPGAWNDDQLRLSLDLLGTEAWLTQQGARVDMTARDAFAHHIAAARGKAPDFDDRKAWGRFDGAANLNPTPSTPHDKLADRLRYHLRRKEPAGVPRPPGSVPLPHQPTPAPTTPAAGPAPAPPPAHGPPILAKPQKLEAAEVLAHLRQLSAAGGLRWNIFTQQIELHGRPIEGADRFYLILAEQGYKVSKEVACDCLVQVARENTYDPVAEYLDHVAATVSPIWIDRLASIYLRPQDAHLTTPTIYDHMMKCTLIGAVRRAFEPGAKHDTATILQGDQGARKSSFWAALAGPFFSDALGDCTTKDDFMILHRSWIMEWSEIDHITNRRHAGQVKAFLSQSTDLFRPPYGKATEAHPRRGIIVGSTNRQGFLADETGNRRFWIIPTPRSESDPIDTGSIAAERDSIWAAAVLAYRDGQANYLPPDLAAQVTNENEAHQTEHPWAAPIAAWLAQQGAWEAISTERVLTDAVQRPLERQTRADQMAVADILRSLGCERRRCMSHGHRAWRWHRPG